MEIIMNIDKTIGKYLGEASNKNDVWLLVKPNGTVQHKLKGNNYDWIYSPYDTPNSKVVTRKTSRGILQTVRSSKDNETVEAMGREHYLKLHKKPYVGQN